jgi:hypothetical protein
MGARTGFTAHLTMERIEIVVNSIENELIIPRT